MIFNALKRVQNRDRKQFAQEFDKENITITKAGKTFNVYDKIQAEREDTEIYPTLEKYGCLDKIMLNEKDLFIEWKKMSDLRSLKDQQIQAEQMWNMLPWETRQEFGNDMYRFANEGEQWLRNKIEAEQKAQQLEVAAMKEVTTNE